jgi:hypothetical protein
MMGPEATPDPGATGQREEFFSEGDMDWRECRYFWNPDTGFVLVTRKGGVDPGKEVARMWMDGAEDRLEGLAWDDLAIVAKVFVEFNTLVVRDRISIDDAHREFLKIRQYRCFVAPDVSGAEL